MPQQTPKRWSLVRWAMFVYVALSASIVALLRYVRDGTVLTAFDGWQPAKEHPVALGVNIALNALALGGLAIAIVAAIRSRRGL